MELSCSSIKFFFIFRETETPKKLFIFQETQTFKSLLYLRKWNFYTQARKIKKPTPKKFPYISRNGTF